MKPIPYFTLSLILISCIIYPFPAINELLIFDRASVMEGQIWRMLTGHLVHFSIEHIVRNALVLILSETCLKWHKHKGLPPVCLLSAMLLNLAVLIFQPYIPEMGGLSGVAISALTYLCLMELRNKGIWKWLAIAVLLITAIKTGYELCVPTFLTLADGSLVYVNPMVHLVGFLVPFLFLLNRSDKSLIASFEHMPKED